MSKTIEIELIQEALLGGNTIQIRALGSSMFPFIRSGDLITIESVNQSNVNIGDIVFCNKDGKLLAHRLINIADNVYFTKGDNLALPDNPVTISQIIGKVIKIKKTYYYISEGTFLWNMINFFSFKILSNVKYFF